VSAQYSLFFYHSWIRIGRTGGLTSSGYILLHTFFEVIFLGSWRLTAKRAQSQNVLLPNVGTTVLRCLDYKLQNWRGGVLTMSRGPMARKKWSKAQLVHSTALVCVSAEIQNTSIPPKGTVVVLPDSLFARRSATGFFLRQSPAL